MSSLAIRIIAIAVLSLGLMGSGAWVVHRIKDAGYRQCLGEQAAAAAAAKDTADRNISKVEKNYGPKLETLRDAPDDHRAVGPLVAHALDGVPRPQ